MNTRHYELFTKHGDFIEHVFHATQERAQARAGELATAGGYGTVVIYPQGDPLPTFEPRPPAEEPADPAGESDKTE